MAWIQPDQAKARKAIPVPLSSAAVAVLHKQISRHQANVFSFRGKPVHQVNTKAWHKALKRIGIEYFRWHDLRHTWASWHVQEGTPQRVLHELGGWSGPEYGAEVVDISRNGSIAGLIRFLLQETSKEKGFLPNSLIVWRARRDKSGHWEMAIPL